MTASNFGDVGQFHSKFGLHNVLIDGVGPQNPSPELLSFRHGFLQEELDEFEAALDVGDDAKAFDALIDIVYVAMGTAHVMGYPWQAGWNRVQAANMAKERSTGDDDARGTRGSRYDVVKPEGWQPPDIDGLLAEYGF